MLGILVELIISWILLYFIEKKHILVLGFRPVLKRIKQFFVGFCFTAILCFGVQYLELFLKSANWVFNEKITSKLLLAKLQWDFISVVTEELLFRGALLYILIKRLNSEKAILISAVAFGIYHWFSFGIFGNIVPMIFVFIGTGTMGYAWALAYYKTKSIWMPIGLHLGWNFTFNSIFSKGSIEPGVLITQGGHDISNWYSLIGLILVPVIVRYFVKTYVLKEDNEFKEQIKTNVSIAYKI